MRFYGREEELATLRSFFKTVCQKEISQMVTVIGRRRVGKTTLILKAFEEERLPVFYFFVERRTSEAELIQSWLNEISRIYQVEFPPTLKTIAELVSYLMTLSKSKPCVCIIDECQELNAVAPNTWSQLQKVWDLKKNQSQMLLVMSGSIISAMEDIFGNDSQPLYGRPSGQITMRPFAPAMIKKIVQTENPQATQEDVLMAYAMTGGVAKYLELFAETDSFSADKMLDYLCSMQGAWLRSEGDIYLANEFRSDAQTYFQILRAIADGANKWNEIESRINGVSQLSPYLSRLERFGIIRKVQPVMQEGKRRTTKYFINDPYFLFWLSFITPLIPKSMAEASDWQGMKKYCLDRLDTFLGRTLERWFIETYRRAYRWEIVGGWWDKNGQNEIDIVAINTSEEKIEFVEVKRNPGKYDESKLKLKATAFLRDNTKLADYEMSYRGLSIEDI